MKLKRIAGFALLLAAVAVSGFKAYNVSQRNESLLVLENLEALTNGETSWEGKKLKEIKCTCKDGKTEGTTFVCDKEGDLEDCTATQQGSTACYTYSLRKWRVVMC